MSSLMMVMMLTTMSTIMLILKINEKIPHTDKEGFSYIKNNIHHICHILYIDVLHTYKHISLTLFFFSFARVALAAYGGFQARGLTRAIAAGLRQSHSNAGSELRVQPIPQLTAMPDPKPTERGQGSNPQPHGS